MEDRFRTSDADRDRVAGLLREHFAVGRLTPEELDERLTATLNARTFGDLRRVQADLPGGAPAPAPVPGPVPRRGPASRIPPQAGPRWVLTRRRPRLLPLMALALIAAVLLPGAGWLFLAVFQAVLLLWLAACLAGIFVAARFYRRMRRDWWSGYDHRNQGWAGYAHHQFGYWRP